MAAETELRRTFMELREGFSRLEGKLDAVLPRVKEDLADQEQRLRKLEERQWWSIGFAAAVSAMVSFLLKSGIFPT